MKYLPQNRVARGTLSRETSPHIVYHIEYIYNKLSTQRPLTAYVHTTGKNYVRLLLTKTHLPPNTKRNGFVSGKKTNHKGQKKSKGKVGNPAWIFLALCLLSDFSFELSSSSPRDPLHDLLVPCRRNSSSTQSPVSDSSSILRLQSMYEFPAADRLALFYFPLKILLVDLTGRAKERGRHRTEEYIKKQNRENIQGNRQLERVIKINK